MRDIDIQIKHNKYLYFYVLQGNYGYGWDDLTWATDHKEIKEDYIAYRDNEPNSAHRIIRRREVNLYKNGRE